MYPAPYALCLAPAFISFQTTVSARMTMSSTGRYPVMEESKRTFPSGGNSSSPFHRTRPEVHPGKGRDPDARIAQGNGSPRTSSAATAMSFCGSAPKYLHQGSLAPLEENGVVKSPPGNLGERDPLPGRRNSRSLFQIMKDQDLFPKGERAFSVRGFDRPLGKGEAELPAQIGQTESFPAPRVRLRTRPPLRAALSARSDWRRVADRQLAGQGKVVLFGKHKKYSNQRKFK